MLPHPWRLLRSLPRWQVHVEDLPDGYDAWCDVPSQTIVVGRHLDQAQRRVAIAHELEHVRRNDIGRCSPGVEREIDRAVARQLIPLDDLIEALLWAQDTHDLHELAAELWVDPPTVEARLDSLSPHERAEIDRRLAADAVGRTHVMRIRLSG